MKKICSFIAFYISFSVCIGQSLPSIHSYTANTIQGYPMTMGSFSGKKILLVNTASFCAYTPQFARLQQLYSAYKFYNFEIIGFPCNDFGAQDPHNDSTINSFCTSNYSVTFQMMSKIEIVGNDTAPVYKWLQRKNLNGVQNVSVAWNFNKFLINESGQWVAWHPSTTDPLDTAITNWIMRPTSIPVGVEELNKDLDFVELISPNPANTYIELQSKNELCDVYSIDMFSVEGRHLEMTSEKICSSQTAHLNVSDLPDGMYFLRVRTSGKEKNFRVILSH